MNAPLFALLVGVDRYSHPDVPGLAGCANDVRAMRQVLVDTFDVPGDHVVELVDEEATRSAIVEAFATHLRARGEAWQRVGGGTEPPAFLFYFSGHGSRARDVTGREPDGYHETIVPHDARHPDVYDIRDLELAAWLEDLPGENTTVVLDCCHSGSGTRGRRSQRVRAVPPDPRPQTDLLDRQRSPTTRSRTRGVTTGGPVRHVLLAACTAEQEAFEHVGDDGTVRGAFTYFLVPQLAAMGAGPRLTYRQLHERVRFAVNDARRNQTPQCEGDVDRLVFDHRRRPWSVQAAVIGIRRERVWLDAGRVHGLTPGSTMALERADGRSAIVALEHVEPVRSAGPVLGRVALPERGTGAHLDRLDLGAHRWRLHVTAADQPATASFVAAMRSGPLAGVVTHADALDDADMVVTVEDGRLLLADASGRRLVAADDPLAFVAAVAHVARFAWLLRSERPTLQRGMPPPVHLRVKALVADTFGERQLTEVSRRPDGAHEVVAGTPLVVELANDARVPLYAALIAFTSDWAVTVLHPSVRGAQDRMAPGATVTVGGAPERSLTAFLPDHADEAIDHLRVVATTHATSFDALALAPPPAEWSAAGPLPPPPTGREALAETATPPRRGNGVPSLWVTTDAVLVTRRD
ncbi:caspase domain-containing protein [Egicoccus sp. AB-alg6-2]|uniref:caspase family protein n=1 Tax=Egicoccus sp. AB-alg6-2 TaxID=3242692 RepID=UPI00359EEE2E